MAIIMPESAMISGEASAQSLNIASAKSNALLDCSEPSNATSIFFSKSLLHLYCFLPFKGVNAPFLPSRRGWDKGGDGSIRTNNKPILTPALSLKERGLIMRHARFRFT